MWIYKGIYHECGKIMINYTTITKEEFDETKEYEVSTTYWEPDGSYTYRCQGRDRNRVFDELNNIRIEDLKDRIAELEEELRKAEDAGFQLTLRSKEE